MTNIVDSIKSGCWKVNEVDFVLEDTLCMAKNFDFYNYFYDLWVHIWALMIWHKKSYFTTCILGDYIVLLSPAKIVIIIIFTKLLNVNVCKNTNICCIIGHIWIAEEVHLQTQLRRHFQILNKGDTGPLILLVLCISPKVCLSPHFFARQIA